MRRQFLLAITLLMLPLAAYAQRAFTIEDLYRLKTISGVQISPDGKSIVYAVTTSDLPRAKSVSNIWMMDIDGRNSRQLTHGEKGEGSPEFSPDGRWISYLDAEDGGLYVIPTTGGKAKKIISISTGVSDPVWSRDAKWITFSSDVFPECNGDDACNKRIDETWSKGPLKAHMADELLFRHWTQWKDGKRSHVFLANAATGELRDLTPGDFDSPPFQIGGPPQYDISPDGSELVYVSNHDKQQASSTNSDLWLISLTEEQPKPRNITAANPAFDGSPKYSPDGKFIAYRMQRQPGYESDLFRLAIYDRATGKSEVLSESFRDWVDDFQWSADSGSIYFSAPVKAQTPIYRLELVSKTITQVLADSAISSFDIGANRVIYTRSSVGEPVEVYTADLSGGKAGAPTRLTHLNE
ncbi:MAG TPA: S9 family peptidase, partial [Blastocatellia bacterium]|nr:S9 family peptidase [Blastocatellia bacterium]